MAGGGPDSKAADRELTRLLDEIEEEVRVTAHLTGRAALDPRVMAAVRDVPRHEFVPDHLWSSAYNNRPLPIGMGQTISQPYVVALMTDLMSIGPDDIVLEVGTGSGYQAAILSRLAKRVYSIEIVRELGEQASERLARLGYDNVETRVGDGYQGWPEHAPFDAIMVTAAAPHVPEPLLEQLRPGGRLVIPVGDLFYAQDLRLMEKDDSGAVITRSVLPVVFVPLTGRYAEGSGGAS